MRCNCGINPLYLADQHVLAEARELGMVAGSLVYNKMKIIGMVPKKLKLGPGHLNFFKDKLFYLHKRWVLVKAECEARGFNIQKPFYDLSVFPRMYLNDWQPSLEDSQLLRERITERLLEKPYLYRYYGKYITEEGMPTFCNKMNNSPLFSI